MFMKTLSLSETANFLEEAKLEQSIDLGWTLVHVGVNASGQRFVCVTDITGSTSVTVEP